VRQYLQDRKWEEKPVRTGVVCYQAPAGKNGSDRHSCVFPSSEQAPDYVLSLTYFLTTLSEIEDRHPIAILEEMLEAQASLPATIGASRP
jgi:hypothetical protein